MDDSGLDDDTPTHGGAARTDVAPSPSLATTKVRAPRSEPPSRASLPSTAAAKRSARTGHGTEPRSGPSAASVTVSSPREALLLAEVRRTHTFAKLVVLTVVFVLGSLFIIPADPIARVVHAAGIVPTLAVATWLSFVLRDETRYRPWMSVLFAGVAGLGIASTFVFWGVFSSGVVIVPIVLYFFAQGSSQAPIVAALVGSVVPHAILGALITTGVVPDLGIIRPVGLDALQAGVVLGIAQFIFGIAYFLARAHRSSTEESMERLEAAARAVAQREALLLEARQELDRALKIGGPGRFTDQVVGHFRLGNVLGRGAMGEVYEAEHVESGEPAAVKLLAASSARDAQIVERFLREVRIAASLDVPNVVRVLETPANGEGVPFLAMERLVGVTLADHLREKGRMSLAEAANMVADLALGLEAAHAAGVIHRDIKPQNVFLHRGEGGATTWKILDFGVSRLAGEGTLTKDQLVGTPTYMPPEQAEGKTVDHRADLYALGVVAYRAITGRPAYSGQDAAAILFRVAGTLPPAPTMLVPSLPPATDLVLAAAMAKPPEGRFQSAAEMRAAFLELAAGRIEPSTSDKGEAALRYCPWGGSIRSPG